MLPGVAILAKIVGGLVATVGQNLIGNKITDYIKERWPYFQDEVSKAEGIERLVVLQSELIVLKNIQIETLKKLLEQDLSNEEELIALEELKSKSIFIVELEKLIVGYKKA